MLKIDIQLCGGRGSSGRGGRGGKRGMGGGGNKPWGNQPGRPAPATLDEALGTKGAPMSESEAMFDANPYYSDDYNEFSENCQRCVFAYEMRRRGYDVEAQPTYQGDTIPTNGNWKQAMSGMTEVNVGRTTERATQKAIENQMKQWGEGSRAIVRVKWAGSNSGHVFNVEYRNGKLIAYDVQSNKRVSNDALFKKYLPYTTLKRTELVRTDNATPTEFMKNMVYTKTTPTERRQTKTTAITKK